MVKAGAVKLTMVLLESLAGTGHKIIRIRPRTDPKLELLYKDPYVQKTVLYKEMKKLQSLKSK